MPNFISKDGIQKPRIERVAYTDQEGMPQIYEGPDRGAVNYMKEQGLDPEKDHLGMLYTEDPDILMRAHERKMTVAEFTKEKLHPKAEREKEFVKKEKEIVTHALPKKSPYRSKGQSGGANFAGATGHLEGGMGESGDALTDAKASVK